MSSSEDDIQLPTELLDVQAVAAAADLPPLTCEICRSPAIGVGASPFGPISHAYCRECNEKNREVYGTLCAGLCGVSRTDVAEWTLPFITATCAFYGKTEDELWADIKKLDDDYNAEMARLDALDAAPVLVPTLGPKPPGHEDCGASTAIDDETITFGSGSLSDYGFWEKPCIECANRYKAAHPETPVWPRAEHEEKSDEKA